MADRPSGTTLLAFAASMILGAGNGVAISFSDRELAPFWGATLRFAIASTVFVLIMVGLKVAFPRGRALGGAIAYGAVGFGASYALIYWGFQFVAPGLGQVIIALVPLLTLLLAASVGLERLGVRPLVGALLALAGIAVVFWGRSGGAASSAGLLAVLGSAFCIAVASVVVKRAPPVHPVAMNAIGMATGTVLLGILSLASREPIALPRLASTWVAVVFVALVGSVAVFWMYIFVLQRWTASATSYQFVILPFIALAISAFLTGERLAPSYAVGAALVLAGVLVGALWRK